MARRTVERLSALEVRKLMEPGLHADGRGLYLRVDKSGARRWVFIFQHQGKRKEMGLGGADNLDAKEANLSLKAARERVLELRKQVTAGENPIEVRRQVKVRKAVDANALTFAQWAEEIAPAIGPKAEKTIEAWKRMMTVWVGPLKDLPPAAVTTEDVLSALNPYWVSRPETATRMRMRLERVLDAAKAKGLISDPWQNPARWKGHLENLLPKRATAVRHQPALDFHKAPAFLADLRELERVAGYALEFTILTAVRNGECRGATWSEFDLEANVWTIPAERMKGEAGKKRLHRVPLTPAAVAVLDKVRPDGGGAPKAFVFPTPISGGKLSENALQGVVNDMGLKGTATVHGFRSTFRDWAGESTNFQRETIEAALAHRLGDETERAYRRGDALLKRRKLMEAWASFLGKQVGSNVRQLGRKSA